LVHGTKAIKNMHKVACSLLLANSHLHFSYKENPFIFSPVPQGTELHKAMQKFRKQVELNFAQESNSLDSVMRHKKLPVRGLKRVQIFAVMTDMFRLIKEMLKHIRQTKIPKTRDELLKKLISNN